MSNQSDRDIVGYLYDAAMGRMSWTDVGACMAALLGGVTLNMFAPGTSLHDLELVATHGLSLAHLKIYAAEFAVHDLWAQAALRDHVFDRAVIGSTVVPDETLRNSIIYNEFLRPTCDAFRLLGAALRLQDGGFAVVSTHRPSDAAEFEEAQRRELEALLPHYVRAIELRQRLGNAAAPDRSATILRDMAQAVVQLGPSGKLVMANEAAERILRERDGFTLGVGGLLMVSPAENKRLQALIRSAACVNAGSNVEPGGYMSISRPSGRYPYRCLVAPLGRDRIAASVDQPAVLLFITDPEQPAVVDPHAVQALFGLTPAEARVAAGLAMGERLPSVARRLGISLNTARTLLARTTAKVHVDSQLELVRAILTTVPRHTVHAPLSLGERLGEGVLQHRRA